METVIDEINQAIKKIGVNPKLLRHLEETQREAVSFSVLNHFVASPDRRWWWEAFRERGKSVAFKNGDGWKNTLSLKQLPQLHHW